MPDDEGLREELIETLTGAGVNSLVDAKRLTSDLLPVVERYAARRAAEALRPFRELFAGGPDTSCRTTWPDNGAGEPIECVEVPLADLRETFDLADALTADGTEPHPAHRHDETGAGL